MKRWKLGVVLAALLALLALPAWAEEVGGVRYVEQVQPDGTMQIRRVIEPTSGEGVVAWDAQNGDLAFAEAELDAYLSGTKPIANGTLVDAGNLKLLVMPTTLMAGEYTIVYVVAPGASKVQIIVNDQMNDWYLYDGEKHYSMFTSRYNGESMKVSARAMFNGTWTELCDAVSIQWTVLGELDAPLITLPETCASNGVFQFSWEPVENAEAYYFYVYPHGSGRGLGGRVDKNTTSVPVVMSKPGTYTAYVRAEATGYRDGESEQAEIVITEESRATDPHVQLTASKTTTLVHYGVEMTMKAEGADAYMLYPQNWYSTNRSATQWVSPNEDTTYVAYARVNGDWIGPSAPVTVKVETYGVLDVPQVTAPMIAQVNEPISISWTPVENAEYYYLEVLRDYGRTSIHLFSEYIEAGVTSANITLDQEGLYDIDVMPYKEGWDREYSEFTLLFVTGEKAQDARVQLSAPARVSAYSDATMKVTAAGAEAYRVYRVPGKLEAEGTSSTLSVECDKPGKYVAYAKVNGAWQGPSAPVTVLLTPDAVLPSSLTEIKAEAFMSIGGEFTAVKCPQGLKRIGARAFEDCWNLRQIEIPASVTEIANDAFDECYDVVICSPEGSYAQRWAQENDIDWIAVP